MLLRALIAVGLSTCVGAGAAELHMAHGWHGGYYLTEEVAYWESLDRVFALLEGAPGCKVALEIEPYTLERMLHGELFDVERQGRDKPRLLSWGGGGPGTTRVECLSEAAHNGRRGLRLGLESGEYVNAFQPLPAADLGGATLHFSAWMRPRGGYAHLYIDAHTTTGVVDGSGMITDPVPADGNWHQVAFDYTVPGAASQIFPQCRIVGPPGGADFDDMSLRRVDNGQELLPNGDFETDTVLALRDQTRLQRLREYVRQGRLEIVGGAYTQPILYMIGQESAAQQLAIGQRAVAEAMGAPASVYMAQEPDWCGQVPQLCRQSGLQGIIYTTSWGAFGMAPTRDAEMVWWVGPDGTRMKTVPEAAAMKAGWGLDAPSPWLMERLAAAGLQRPYLLSLGDLCPESILAPSPPLATGEIYSGLAHLCVTTPAQEAAGQDVELSAWLRTTQPTARLLIDAYAGAMNLGSAQSQPVPGDGQWHRLALRYHVADSAERMYPQAKLDASADEATLDIAGFSLKVIGGGRELLPRNALPDSTLPEGWYAGGYAGADAEGQVLEEENPGGPRLVRLTLRAREVPVKLETPSQYLAGIGEPVQEWRDAYAGFEHRYPWGILAGRHLRADREMERTLLAALRADAMGERKLSAVRDDLWRLVLMGQHHDAWVCGPTPPFGIWRATGLPCYANLTTACQGEFARKLAAAEAAPAPQGTAASVVNAAGTALRRVQEVSFAPAAGACREPLVVDAAGQPLPALVEIAGRHPDGSAAQVSAAVAVDIPALASQQVRVVEAAGRTQPVLPEVNVTREGEAVTLANDQTAIRVSPEGLDVLQGDRSLLRAPAHVAGEFPAGPQVSRFADLRVESRPGRATVTASGSIANVGLTLRVTLDALCPVAQVTLACDFGPETLVGEGPREEPLRPAWAHEARKLRWVFPLAAPAPRFLAHGAFELREPSREAWPILDAAIAHDQAGGLALYPDRATSGVFRGAPASLEVVLAYGGSFMYAPGEASPLTGSETYRLGVYPFAGDLESAQVAQRAEAAAAEAYTRVTAGPGQATLARLTPPEAASVATCYAEGGDTVLRLWRPYEGERRVTVEVPGAREVFEADLAGTAGRKLGDGQSVAVTLHQGQILTLRAR